MYKMPRLEFAVLWQAVIWILLNQHSPAEFWMNCVTAWIAVAVYLLLDRL